MRSQRSDGRNLESFIAGHKQAVPFGIIVYHGKELKMVRKNIWAVPDWALFGAF